MLFLSGLLAVFSLAAWIRLDGLGETSALQDSIGPHLAVARMDGRAHADPYGILLLPPYWVASFQGSLWGATGFLLVVHALVAPVGMAAIHALRPSAKLVGVVAGTALALDPGLLDTARSGAEGYLAALFVGLMLCSRGGWIWLMFATAVANHPLAVCGAPLLFWRPDRALRTEIWGIIAAMVFIGHQALGWRTPGVGGTGFEPLLAVEAFLQQGRGVGMVMLFGPIVGLLKASTRRLSVCTLVALALLIGAGEFGDYLRDHHLRILAIPLIACWAWISAPVAAAIAGAAMFSIGPDDPPAVAQQPGTVSLANLVSESLSHIDGPIHVERVWFDGGPAVEPAAILLDAHLRDDPYRNHQPDGRLILIVAGHDTTMASIGAPGEPIMRGPAFTVTATTADEASAWLEPLCDRVPRVGGSWDGYSAVRPETTLEDIEARWACR